MSSLIGSDLSSLSRAFPTPAIVFLAGFFANFYVPLRWDSAGEDNLFKTTAFMGQARKKKRPL